MAGIYIHIPFCKQACSYCDFHFSASLKRKPELIPCIVKEIELRKSELENQQVKTIYFGGGTPSILTINEIKNILSKIYNTFNVVNNPEITLEANPDDLTLEKIIALSNTKINRLSIGVQSFFDDDLQFMNRAHTAEESKRCIENALLFFKNVTIDLIYGLPKMTNNKWKQNLKIAFELGVPHISSYALTVEEKTALFNFIKKGKVKPLSEELALKHFNILVSEAKKNGFVQYEISNFAKEGYISQHNASYWLGENYLGIGPSAHSFNGKNRSWNIANNGKYIQAINLGVLPLEIEELTKNNRFNEAVMMGLRTIWGVSLSKIEEEFGKTYFKNLKNNAQLFIKKDLLKIDSNNQGEMVLLATEKGKFLIDGIASELFVVEKNKL